MLEHILWAVNVYKFAPLVITPWMRQTVVHEQTADVSSCFCGPGPSVRLSRSSKKQFVSSTTSVRGPLSRCWNTRSGPAIWRRTLRTRTTERQLFQQWTVPQQSMMRLVKSLTGDIAYFYVSNYPFLGGEAHLIDDAFFDRERWNSHRTFVWFVITSSKPINFFLLILYWFH